MKLGFIIDSSTGLTRDEAKRKGWGFLPLHISINGREYADGIDLETEQFYSIINRNDKVSSACSAPGEITEVFEEMSKKYDEIICLPLSTHLSSQNENLSRIAKEYKKVHVITSKVVAMGGIFLLDLAEKLHKEGVPIKEIIKRIEKAQERIFGMIMPENMDWLRNGGRISRSTAALGNLLNIIPIVSWDGKMEKWGKGRSLPKALLKSIAGIFEVIDSKKKNEFDFVLYTSFGKGDENRAKMEKKMLEIASKQVKEKIIVVPLPRVLTVHVGPGSFCLMAIPKEI